MVDVGVHLFPILYAFLEVVKQSSFLVREPNVCLAHFMRAREVCKRPQLPAIFLAPLHFNINCTHEIFIHFSPPSCTNTLRRNLDPGLEHICCITETIELPSVNIKAVRCVVSETAFSLNRLRSCLLQTSGL